MSSNIYSSQKKPSRRNNDDCNSCKDKDNPTQHTITHERFKICSLLYDSSGELSKQEEKFVKENELYGLKKCLFTNTEDNYRRYRNLDIATGSELLQTNESVKANVTEYNKWNKELNTALKNIAKAVKEAKTKFAELKKAACDLDSCYNDSCNKAQKKALTGKSEGCKDETPVDACSDAEKIFGELICMPKGLASDIDSLFKSSHDVVGIQVFSNIETLEPLQKNLEEQSKSFQKQIADVVKLREGDLKKQQEELVKSVKEITKSAMDRNNARSKFEGYYDAADFLCCPECDCVTGSKNNTNDNDCDTGCDPRLKVCEDKICDICGKVKETFCCTPKKDDCDDKTSQSK
jgi:hypothetical protein